jgi:hypothetical protein
MTKQKQPIRSSTENHEWYTPAAIMRLTYAVMGGVDLDPASNAGANRTVGARRYFTKEDDGLAQEWGGRVWLNPPYGKRNSTGIWWEKLLAEYDAGRVTEAMFLANSTTETKWFHEALSRFPVLFLSGRVSFWRPGAPSSSGFLGTCIVYMPIRPYPPVAALDPSERPLASVHTPSTFHPERVARFAHLAAPLGLTVVNMSAG